MSFPGDGEDAGDTVVLQITDTSSAAAAPSSPLPPPVSVSDLARFDPLPSPTVAVRADRHRLIGSSSYFRALLGGSFSESGREYVQLGCNLEAAVQVLRYLFEPSESFAITHDNFILLLEGALFLSVESLLLECERWFRAMAMGSHISAPVVPLDFVIEVWYFAQDHAVTFVQDICPKYLAQNFGLIISRRSFNKVPYDLLHSTSVCPHLTVDSEKQLCEAILYWVSENMKPSEQPMPNLVDGHLFLLSKVKICLLPLEFATGTKRHWFDFGNHVICTILNLLKDSLKTLLDAIADGTLECYCIRITEYSKNIVLSGCPQITTALLYISVLPTDLAISFKRRIVRSYTQVDNQSFIVYDELEKAAKTFRNVHMVDLSKCPNVHFGAAIDWLKLAFPELRIFRALHCLSFQFDDLLYLLLRCPCIDEIDMTIDASTITPKQSVVSSNSEDLGKAKQNPRRYYEPCQLNSVFSYLSRLTLEGRNDIDDVDLLKISVLKNSLCYINIRNCTLLTDGGISNLLLKCTKIHSMVLSYTSFGNRSIQTLCTTNPPGHGNGHGHVMAFNMQELHLGGCKDIDSAALSQLMSSINITKFLCLRETSLTDVALCNFIGSSLEYLDVSETVVSMVSLAPVIRQNCDLKCLKTAGCRSLLFECDEVERISGNKYGDFLQEIGSTCRLEDIEVGWGFCPIHIKDLIPSFSKVRKMTVGLGTTLAENVLHALPVLCPSLESLTLRFQVISDSVIRNLLESATNLQVLCLHYCLGSLTSFSFQTKAPALRVLRLQWATPWLTNDDLKIITENCNLSELSLSGCKLLDPSSQEIISFGWPNLVLLHLEDCGQVTVKGVSSVLNCKALEDVLLRHTGRGIERSIIDDAIRELPLLRKLALDLCDACEEGYDSPNNAEGKMIRVVRMSRCKTLMGSCLELPRGASKPVHKDTVVLEWSSKRLTTTIVKERV